MVTTVRVQVTRPTTVEKYKDNDGVVHDTWDAAYCADLAINERRQAAERQRQREREAQAERDRQAAQRAQEAAASRAMAGYCNLKVAQRDGFANYLTTSGLARNRQDADHIAFVVFETQKTAVKYLQPVIDYKKTNKITHDKVNERGCC